MKTFPSIKPIETKLADAPKREPKDLSKLKAAFHKCWGEAHDSPNYNKQSWLEFQQLIESL